MRSNRMLLALVGLAALGASQAGIALGQESQPVQPVSPFPRQVDIRADGTIMQHDGKGGTFTYHVDKPESGVYRDIEGKASTIEIDANGDTITIDSDGRKTVNADPASLERKAALDRLQRLLGATDEEWKALAPLIAKVQRLTADLRIPSAGPLNVVAFGRLSDVQKAARKLEEVLKPGTTADAIAEAIKALHDAKATTLAERDKAMKSLKELLTVRQEAQLINLGVVVE